MGIVHNLSLLALRPVVGAARASAAPLPADGAADPLPGWLAEHFAQSGAPLSAALQEAARRTWLALEVALAGDAGWQLWQEGPTLTAAPGLRDAVRTFLDNVTLGPVPEEEAFRVECGRELRAARKKGAWEKSLPDLATLAEGAGVWGLAPETSDPHDAERDLLERTAEEFRQRGGHQLARLLDSQAQQPAPLLAQAARFFFRRTQTRDPELARTLPPGADDGVPPGARRGLEALAGALDQYGAQLETMLDEPARATTEPAREALDLRREHDQHVPALQEVAREVLPLLQAARLERRGLRPGDILALRAPEQRQLIRQLAARFREVHEDDARLAPALLNALGKLQAYAGDLDAAYDDFQRAVGYVPDLQTQAEVFANAYLVALELRRFDDALTNLNRASARDPERYAPFPLTKYEAEKILRCDGFGVVFLCRHRNAGTNVTVRSLRLDVLERRVDDIFHDVQVLDTLEYPAIARLRDCDYADAEQTRPYLVHDDFAGETLAEYVAAHGPLAPADLLAVMKPVAEALQAAHGKHLLHASIQPAHVLVRKDEGGWRVKLVNFGLSLRRSVIRDLLDRPDARSRLAVGASVTAALECAAPEQLGRLDGVPVGPAADVYAFGRTCYAALLRTTEPDDQEKEQLDPGWRKLLGQCTAWNITRRLAGFGPVLERLAQISAAPPMIRLNPEEAAVCVQRGIAARQKGDTDQAFAEFNRAVQLDPRSALAFQGRANTYSTRGEYERAIADYTKALELDPRLALSFINRGLAYVKLRQTERAIADYTKALEIDPKLALGYLNRGSAYARTGEYDRAVKDFTEALKIDARLPVAYVNRGLAFAKRGDLERAIADYTRALELEPGNTTAKARRAEAEQLRDRQGEAVQTKKRARGMLEAAAPATKPAAPAAKPAAPAAPAARQGAPAAPGRPNAAPAARPAAPGKAEAPAADRPAFVLEGHTEAVRCVAFSPDGRRLVSGSEDKTLRLWDPRSGKKLGRYSGHTGGVTSVAFAPNGQHVLSGSQDHSVRLWNVETGEEVRRFGSGRFFGGGGHTEAVVSVAFSPDGAKAVSAGWDKTVRVWEVDTGKELRALEGHQWLIHSAAFCPDGKHIVYGSEDQTVRLWNVETGEEARRYEGHGSWVLSVAVSPDGRLVLSGGSDGTIRLWSVARGKELRRFGGQMGLVQSVAFAPSGKHALSGEYTLPGENTLMRVWEVESGLEMARFTGHEKLIWGVACASDGKLAATASADNTVRVWQLPKFVT